MKWMQALWRISLVLLGQVDLQQVALRHHADETVPVDHGQVAATRLLHLAQALLVGFAGLRDHEVLRHHLAHRRAIGIELRRDHAAHHVPLGEDADEARAVEHRHRSHATLRHVSARVAHRVIGPHVEDLAPGNQSPDRLHASSSASSGWRRKRR
jgi:hypothetical protein